MTNIRYPGRIVTILIVVMNVIRIRIIIFGMIIMILMMFVIMVVMFTFVNINYQFNNLCSVLVLDQAVRHQNL